LGIEANLYLYPIPQIAVFAGFRLYAPQRLAAAEEFRRLMLAVAIGRVAFVLLSFWSDDPLSRPWIATTWLGVATAVCATRVAWRRWVGREREAGRLALR